MQSHWARLRTFENFGHCYSKSHPEQKFSLSFFRNSHREEDLLVTCAEREETPEQFLHFCSDSNGLTDVVIKSVADHKSGIAIGREIHD